MDNSGELIQQGYLKCQGRYFPVQAGKNYLPKLRPISLPVYRPRNADTLDSGTFIGANFNELTPGLQVDAEYLYSKKWIVIEESGRISVPTDDSIFDIIDRILAVDMHPQQLTFAGWIK